MAAPISPEQAMELLAQARAGVFSDAARLREAAFGKRINICSIINIRSGNCGMDCKFCSQSGHYRGGAPVYPLLDDQELARRIERLAAMPIAHIGLVSSGASLAGAEFERLCRFLERLPRDRKKRLCLSLGRLEQSQFEELRSLGIGHYHHNLETSRDWYPHICGTQSWDQRRDTVLRALAAGFELCCGALFGIGESWKDRIDLALCLADLGIADIPMNFLDPRPGTPLASCPRLPAEEALAIIHVFRRILPKATLRVCGGRACLGDRASEIFAAGANALMTGNYLTTSGAAPQSDRELLQSQNLINDYEAP